MSPFWEAPISLTITRRNNRWVEPSTTYSSAARYVGRPFTRRQIMIVVLMVVVSFVLLAGRAYNLQVVNGDTFTALSEGNRIRSHAVLASRGVVFDRYGRALTENVPEISIAFVPFDVPRDDVKRGELFSLVSSRSNISAQYLEATWQSMPAWRKKSVDPYPLDIDISVEDGLRLRLEADDWPGIAVVTQPRRVYSYGAEIPSLSHIVGYVGGVTENDLESKEVKYSTQDVVGKTGVESQYELLLKGKNGARNVEVNALGVEQKLYSEQSPESGRNLWLTIDVDLQRIVEVALRAGMERVGVNKGAAVVLDPRSGEILAAVSWPGFDPNPLTGVSEGADYGTLLLDPDQPLFNRLVQGRYPSGSTIKPVVAAAALEEGIITGATKFNSTGGIWVGKWFFPDWKTGGHGVTDVRKALADSVNTFFYIIGGGYEQYPGLGMEIMEKYARKFGMAELTGIDLPGEVAGLIPTVRWKQEVKGEPWYIGDTYHAAIGQGDVLVTPLQVAQFTSVFANGGTMLQPHVVLESEVTHAGERKRVQPIIQADRVVSPSTVQIIREGMRQAVTDGSAIRLNSLPITSAGKTGTAELGGTKKPHAWFTGFAPYENPELVITVLIEEGDGSNNAMPVVYEILKWWAENRYDPVEQVVR